MLAKSNSPNGTSKLAEQLANEVKTNEALSRVIGLLNDWMEEQKEMSSDSQIAHSEMCDRVDGLIKTLDKYYSREEKEPEKDTSVADAIKALKFPEQKPISLEPLARLANSIEQQNKQHLEILNKISQPQPQLKQDTSGYESLVRESLAAIAKNNESIKSIAESIKQINKPSEERKPISYKHDIEYFQSGAIKSITTKPIS